MAHANFLGRRDFQILLKSKGMRQHTKTIPGDVLWQLTAIEFSKIGDRPTWKWLCTCGKIMFAEAGRVRFGAVKSCGCFNDRLRRERTFIHGHALAGKHTTEYNSWYGMKIRCKYPLCPTYKNYGGRGIKVCERWKNSFKNFIDDMGLKPTPKHSIDRINNNLGYSPENCRWATRKEQDQNRVPKSLLTYKGETKSLVKWAYKIGISPEAMRLRVKSGKSEDYIFEPRHGTSGMPSRKK